MGLNMHVTSIWFVLFIRKPLSNLALFFKKKNRGKKGVARYGGRDLFHAGVLRDELFVRCRQHGFWGKNKCNA